MKTLSALILAALLCGCTSRTEFGECVGVGGDKRHDLSYKASGWNVFLAVLFFETIAVPVVVAVDQLYCPVGKKEVANASR